MTYTLEPGARVIEADNPILLVGTVDKVGPVSTVHVVWDDGRHAWHAADELVRVRDPFYDKEHRHG